MDIKWKNKIILICWGFLFTLGLSGLLGLVGHGNDYAYRDIFDTPGFREEVDQFVHDLSMFELYDLTMEEAKESLTVTDEEIDEYRYGYGDHVEKESSAWSFGNSAEETVAESNESDKAIRDLIMNEKTERLEQAFQEKERLRPHFLRYKKEFAYYFEDVATGEVHTNLDLPEGDKAEGEMNQKNTLFITSYSLTSDQLTYIAKWDYEMTAAFPDFKRFEGQIAVPKSSNYFQNQNEGYTQRKNVFWIYVLAGISLFIISMMILKRSKSIKSEVEAWMPFFKKLPIDIRVLILLASGIFAVIFTIIVSEEIPYGYENPLFSGVEMLIFTVFATPLWGLNLLQVKSLTTDLKNTEALKSEWNKSLLYRAWLRFKSVLIRVYKVFLKQKIGRQLLMIFSLFFALGLSVIIIAIHPILVLFYILFLAAVGVPLIIFLINRVEYFNEIVQKTTEMASGKLGGNLPVAGKSELSVLAENINRLKQGVKTSQNEQAKSERLKTELITNVSHDLRTPLTSIITYTELLKGEEVSQEERKAYVEIIDQKSKRLKMLIDDLFEVSKMVSGNIELRKERIDLVQLLHQALAEYDTPIKESSLEFRVSKTEHPVYSHVDGQKLWRVFDNLISNILKYSLEHSRVFINVQPDEDHALITFKNVSKYELSENAIELLERFKRGDESRHTEGSGLGLAIAKSIIDLHEGSFDIETDGDLFKVIIWV